MNVAINTSPTHRQVKLNSPWFAWEGQRDRTTVDVDEALVDLIQDIWDLWLPTNGFCRTFYSCQGGDARHLSLYDTTAPAYLTFQKLFLPEVRHLVELYGGTDLEISADSASSCWPPGWLSTIYFRHPKWCPEDAPNVWVEREGLLE